MTSDTRALEARPKLCRDCKWMREPTIKVWGMNVTVEGSSPTCAAPAPERERSLVDGEFDFKFCEILRKQRTNFCGPDAAWFEPK